MFDFTGLSVEQMETRKLELAELAKEQDADLDAIEEEARALATEIETRKAEEAKRVEIRNAVASGDGKTTEKAPQEERKIMTNEEVRNSKQYIDAYAEYIKSGNDTECRALLTENATNGTVPIPEFVYEIVKNAWAKEGIMSRVRKSYLKGNLKVGFEISADGAYVHTEGGGAVTEESLTLGIVTLVPETIKKWISVSDEVMDMRGESFLRYIYDELTYRIAKKAADELVAAIVAAGTSSVATAVGLPKVTQTQIAVGNVAAAIGNLSDQASDPVIIMNKLTWSAFKEAQYANSFSVDPFEGLPVLFSDKLPAFSAATTGICYMIVGDLGEGALANFPDGEGIQFKYDDMTLATSDLVRVIGRMPVALGIVGPQAFVRVVH
jgi:HK97 family phage major capsid protein